MSAFDVGAAAEVIVADGGTPQDIDGFEAGPDYYWGGRIVGKGRARRGVTAIKNYSRRLR